MTEPDDCECEFTPDPDDPDENTPEAAWHFLRTCPVTGKTWFALHCEHDGHQWPCPHCGGTHAA
jgi:hypothetical protein